MEPQVVGTCEKCGARRIINPKTGKEFCEKKCWLNNQQPIKPMPTRPSTQEWEKIREEKNENIKWLNALNNATLLASTGKILIEDMLATAEKIYKMSPNGKDENNETSDEVKHIPF